MFYMKFPQTQFFLKNAMLCSFNNVCHIPETYAFCEAAMSPRACSSSSFSLCCLARTSALSFDAAALLSLCSSSDSNSSFSAAVGSTG